MADEVGKQNTPEADRKKAQTFFSRGKTVADTGQYDYAIEMYLQGLALDPEAIDAHKGLRDVALKRKAGGGKPMSMISGIALKRPMKDAKQSMLNAEKLLSFDPGNTDHMAALLQGAQKGGYFDTAMWIGPILYRANLDQKKPEFAKFILLKDAYKSFNEWQLAIDACHQAARLHPDDMELATELKNMAASQTMKLGKYGNPGGFRGSMKDADKQQQLLLDDKGVGDAAYLDDQIRRAEEQYAEDPNEAGKLLRLVEALVKTEQMDREARAMELLDAAFNKYKRYNYRLRYGEIEMKQFARMVRSLEAQLKADPHDESLKKDVLEHKKEQFEKELVWFQEFAKNYSMEMRYRFEAARRLFLLRRFPEAIPLFQEASNDPKLRSRAALYLGQSFLAAGFPTESAEVLGQLINDYPTRGDDESREMFYWRGRALEQLNQTTEALKLFSQLAQWDFNYRDVQPRIKQLRSQPQAPQQAPPILETGN